MARARGTARTLGLTLDTAHDTSRQVSSGHLNMCQTFGLLFQSLDLTLSDLPIGNPKYVLSCPWATLGQIICGISIKKSEKICKIPGVFWKNLPMGGLLGNQTVFWGCAPEDSLITPETFLKNFFQDNPAYFPLFISHSLRALFVCVFLASGAICCCCL